MCPRCVFFGVFVFTCTNKNDKDPGLRRIHVTRSAGDRVVVFVETSLCHFEGPRWCSEEDAAGICLRIADPVADFFLECELGTKLILSSV